MKVRWDLVAVVYLALAVLGAALSFWIHGACPLMHPSPNLGLGPIERHALSFGLGLVAAGLVVTSTRVAVARARWAARLHGELRPVAVGMSGNVILGVAAISSLGEEMFFRSFLTPWIGVWAQALLFGVLHQTRGSGRWVWMGWAALVGLGLGWLYVSTGSLAGPLVAHMLINAVNLRYLRDHDPAARLSR